MPRLPTVRTWAPDSSAGQRRVGSPVQPLHCRHIRTARNMRAIARCYANPSRASGKPPRCVGDRQSTEQSRAEPGVFRAGEACIDRREPGKHCVGMSRTRPAGGLSARRPAARRQIAAGSCDAARLCSEYERRLVRRMKIRICLGVSRGLALPLPLGVGAQDGARTATPVGSIGERSSRRAFV
jgi:hypothetical protein